MTNIKKKPSPFSAWEEEDIEYNIDKDMDGRKGSNLERKPSKNQLKRFNVDQIKEEIKEQDGVVLVPRPFNHTVNFGKNYLYKNAALQKTIKSLNYKGRKTNMVDIAAVIATSKKNKEDDVAEPFVSTEAVVSDLRKINKTNYVRQNIEQEYEQVEEQLRAQEHEYEQLHCEMEEAKLRFRATFEKAEDTNRKKQEHNKELERALEALSKNLSDLEKEKNDLHARISEHEKEIVLYHQCYDFVYELMPEERQKEVDEARPRARPDPKDGKRRPEMDITQDEDYLVQKYKRAYGDIQTYLINTDLVQEKINDIDGIAHEREDALQCELEKQRVMYGKKQAFLLAHAHADSKDKDASPKEAETKFFSVYNEVLKWLESNSSTLTKGYKTFKNTEIGYREAVTICLAAEQVLEEYINLIRAERLKAKGGDSGKVSLVKAYNEVNKDRKKKDPKVTVDEGQDRNSTRLERARRISERVKGLTGKRRPMQMCKLGNKKVEVVHQVDKEEKMEDYVDNDNEF